MLNKITIIGHLGANPELTYTIQNIEMCRFSVATNEKFRDRATGELNEITTWHNVSVFGKMAKVCSEHLTKGSKVYVEGPLRSYLFTPKNTDVKVKTFEIKADNILFLSIKGAKDQKGSELPSPFEEPDDPNDNDDLPF